MSDETFDPSFGKSAIYCPECAGDCLTDGHTLTCIECSFETTADAPEGRRVLRRYHRRGGDADVE